MAGLNRALQSRRNLEMKFMCLYLRPHRPRAAKMQFKENSRCSLKVQLAGANGSELDGGPERSQWLSSL